MRLILAALILALTGCMTDERAVTIQPLYYVMRHLHTPAEQSDPDLTPEGRTAARNLIGMFGRERPAAIYVSTYKRSRQSAAPLALSLGLTPIGYDPADTPALVARVRQGPWPVLIVGHSNTVPDIIAQLGGARPAPLGHPDFGDLWRVDAQGRTARSRIQ